MLAVVAAGLLGALIATIAHPSGAEDVCPARDVATRALPSAVTVQAAQGATGRGPGPVRSSAVTATSSPTTT